MADLPEFEFKIRPPKSGTLSSVLAQCSSDIHMLIVAEDSVDVPTRKILSRGLLLGGVFYVPSYIVKEDFGLNGHLSDHEVKTVLLYGFSDSITVTTVSRFNEANGPFEEELRRHMTSSTEDKLLKGKPKTPYACAVIYRSKYVPSQAGEMVERVYLSNPVDTFLAKNALKIEVPNPKSKTDGIPYLRQYYIMPGGLWGDLLGTFSDAQKAQTAPRIANRSLEIVAQL
ncbi:hypothetical protein JW758_00810 [Candidatus Peregrinibacteria bacterium]|nr:hypothetical protein [Candidatus Peregrinibacteria bacterium]